MQLDTKIPTIKWAQRKDRLFIKIDVVEVQNPKIEIVNGTTLTFQGSDKTIKYALDLELYGEVEVDPEEFKYASKARNIFLNIKKKESGPYWPRLTKENRKFNYIQIDWTYYIDEDEEDENDNKMPSFGGNEQGFPGFGGDDELNDEDDLPEPELNNADTGKASLDDLDQEASK